MKWPREINQQLIELADPPRRHSPGLVEVIEANAEAEMILDGIGPNRPARLARLSSSPREFS